MQVAFIWNSFEKTEEWYMHHQNPESRPWDMKLPSWSFLEENDNMIFLKRQHKKW